MQLLTPEQMGQADQMAAASGIDSHRLMMKAGEAVSAAVLRRFPAAVRMVVLCGPGNNGGDGYIAAKALFEAGCNVSIYHFGDLANLKGDVAQAFNACPVKPQPLAAYAPKANDVVVDALFGAGLTRSLDPAVQSLILNLRKAGSNVVAVDLPSGISGGTGAALGTAVTASHTITFMRPKPGHFLLPGREHCGTLETFDIGIPQRILTSVAGNTYLNEPSLWKAHLPATSIQSHKFKRGHLTVFSGGHGTTGAARLSATAGLKAGAGLVTLATPSNACTEATAHLTAIMLREINNVRELSHWLEDKRLSAFVLGPGFGIGEKARDYTNLLAGNPVVLDADGITSFAESPDRLFYSLSKHPTTFVLTPHEGEFARLFPDIHSDKSLGKLEKARAAASRSNAVVLYKGADTVITAPDGRAAINANAPPWLATAGSGDVLSGIIGSLLAQEMPPFEAACAGAWLHGAAGQNAGEGLSAEDLPNGLPKYSQIS
ncbi:NAD(P)H-hydrate dehydratase [Martelella mediterranea]|uniref:Bifunctional NAD(P)H-hydrate repair enzyme n=1 Tax=Martelella mediterranea TaxID=293089 RepID=A0A4R3NSN0_9HYPH|nr:NAD(P)H-hydrate dehydratase [Martelella mediterranea]TCT39323.1 NAD(P)H-hydrate epimerase [Martelella mediterranea]